MPAIYLFNRRTFLGGDDLQPAVFLALLVRLIQFTILLGPIVAQLAKESHRQGGFFFYVLFDSNQWDDSCRHSHVFGLLLLSYAVGSGCYSIGSALVEWRISYWAGVGAPTQTEPRSTKISYLLELKLMPFPIVLFLIFCTGLTMIAFAPHYYQCNTDQQEQHNKNMEQGNSDENHETLNHPIMIGKHIQLWWVTVAILLLTQLSELFVSWLYLLHLCSEPSRSNYFHTTTTTAMVGERTLYEEEYAISRHELVEEMWAKRCATACQCLGVASCFMFGGREVLGQGDFGDGT